MSTVEIHEAPAIAEHKTAKTPLVVGIVAIVAGLFLSIAGIFSYNLVGNQLQAQDIVVADDASFMAGEPVEGPFSAYAEAQIINEHALHSTEGKTYSQMDREDPLRTVAMNASFLQASLYTSVVAFGLAALVAGLGVMFILFGAAFVALAKVTK
jgi:hypothetical protein